MVGKTAPIRNSDRVRFDIIKTYCGCLPCLLRGFLDRPTTIEHATSRGRRVGKGSEQHESTIGLCTWHHFGVKNRAYWNMAQVFGPSLAKGRRTFEDEFGDEVTILVPTQDFMLAIYAERPWGAYSTPREVAREVRAEWKRLLAGPTI